MFRGIGQTGSIIPHLRHHSSLISDLQPDLIKAEPEQRAHWDQRVRLDRSDLVKKDYGRAVYSYRSSSST